MEKSNQKKALVLSIVGVVTLILVVVGATFAYFTAQGGTGANADVNTQTYTTDNLSFQVGESISIEADQTNFAQGEGNQSGETFAKAILTANNNTNTATMNYYVYLNITENDFEYTTADEQAELLLKITAPDGSEIITLGDLERKTSGNETGFDITTKTGLITIADNYEITANPNKTDEWTVEVILVNLDSDQNANTGKTFSATLIIQEEPDASTLAYHETCTSGTMACDIARLYNEENPESNGLYLHDADLTNGANDNSYRYAGANPNNYVCFGSDEESCPTDNLYRIIGVFNGQVKLIKSDYAGESVLGTAQHGSTTPIATYYKGSLSQIPSYIWSGSSSNQSNTWSASTLNTGVLNGTYLTALGSEWSEKIATTNWQVGGGSYSNLRDSAVQTAYNYEVGTNKANTTYSAKIGLMYVSDYGYAASPENWNTVLYDYDNDTNRNNNWMHMGATEWTISRNSDITGIAFRVSSGGVVDGIGVSGHSGVRPSFYLESSVEFSRGSGSSADPYRIS